MKGILGPDTHDMKAITILNRIVEWIEARIQYEADPWHVDLIDHRGAGTREGERVGCDLQQSGYQRA